MSAAFLWLSVWVCSWLYLQCVCVSWAMSVSITAFVHPDSTIILHTVLFVQYVIVFLRKAYGPQLWPGIKHCTFPCNHWIYHVIWQLVKLFIIDASMITQTAFPLEKNQHPQLLMIHVSHWDKESAACKVWVIPKMKVQAIISFWFGFIHILCIAKQEVRVFSHYMILFLMLWEAGFWEEN